MSDEINLRIVGVDSGDEIAGARRIAIRTTRGAIAAMLHRTSDAHSAALCVSGAIGGFDGPAMLYPRLGLELPRRGISVMRADYRAPNEFGECVLDTMAAISVLKGLGHNRVALVGHSFGGAVAINAGTLSDVVTTVVAISSQLAGSHVVADLSPRPLLLIHGTADQVLSHESSQMLYERAREPKTLKLFEGADHSLRAVADGLCEVVESWIVEKSGRG
jgi:uncharacterized protein